MFSFLQLKGLWQHSDFMKLWLGQTISLFGSAVTNLALPLTAALTLQATPAQMGLLKGAEFVPFLLIGLVVGVWVDRQRRRPILIVAWTFTYRTPLFSGVWDRYS
jgi:MFS family permease